MRIKGGGDTPPLVLYRKKDGPQRVKTAYRNILGEKSEQHVIPVGFQNMNKKSQKLASKFKVVY